MVKKDESQTTGAADQASTKPKSRYIALKNMIHGGKLIPVGKRMPADFPEDLATIHRQAKNVRFEKPDEKAANDQMEIEQRIAPFRQASEDAAADVKSARQAKTDSIRSSNEAKDAVDRAVTIAEEAADEHQKMLNEINRDIMGS